MSELTDLNRESIYDHLTGKMIQKVTYDNTEVIEGNKVARNLAPEFGRYKGDLAHVGRIHMGDVERLRNIGYDLLSADPEEVKRALLYIQSNESHLLTVPGKPIAKKKTQWV